jgi:hypothetical protein
MCQVLDRVRVFLSLTERPDPGRPMCHWTVSPCRQHLYKWARESRFVS